MEPVAARERGMGLLNAWFDLSAEPAWSDIVAWLVPVFAIFLTLFAVELRRGYRE
jgi:hypothetical protein